MCSCDACHTSAVCGAPAQTPLQTGAQSNPDMSPTDAKNAAQKARNNTSAASVETAASRSVRRGDSPRSVAWTTVTAGAERDAREDRKGTGSEERDDRTVGHVCEHVFV